MKRRVLIVEDDVSVVSSLEFHLQAADHETRSVSSAAEALAIAHDFRPQVVLAESRLADSTAIELIQTLHSRGVDADVIVIAARRSMRDAVDSISNGAYDYLAKPLDTAQLDSTLSRCFRDRAARWRALDCTVEMDRNPIVGSTPGMIEIYKTIARVSKTSAPVLIRGETGTGKELVARSLHRHSERADHDFVAINCAAMPESLLESELFGHVRGAFTGAIASRRGRFESSGRGTLFLDEIGDTSPAFQAKLLRVVQDGEFFPVGSERPRRSESRVIAATLHDMEELVRAGRFRMDLYFRLRVVEIFVPPLRERPEDILPLAEHFLAKATRETGKPVRVIPPDVARLLGEHDWPGNVRELENAVTRAVVLSRGPALHPEDLGLDLPASDRMGYVVGEGALSVLSMDDVEHRQIRSVLEKTDGNKRQAARILRISRGRLDRLIRKHSVDVDDLSS